MVSSLIEMSEDKLIDEIVANASEESIKDIVDLIVDNNPSLNPIDVELYIESIESYFSADDSKASIHNTFDSQINPFVKQSDE